MPRKKRSSRVQRRQKDSSKRRKLIGWIKRFIFVSIAVYFTLTVVRGDSGVLRLFQLRAKNAGLSREIKRVTFVNLDLEREITRLKTDNDYITRIAVQRYSYVPKGKVLFRFTDLNNP